MPLLTFWTSDPHAVEELSAEQVVASAGDGALKDDSNCSQELREYLSQIPSNKIAMYIDRCLCSGFNQSAMVLQDLVNELGRRLGYDVTNGRYQETHNAIGCDGIWMSPEAHTIVAEVKTTDAYRISLDTIASYRDKLLASNKIAGSSSILIVVGREDTGELEAQVRGSRHAWDIRMISADSMIKLVQLKENADDPDAGKIIRSLLTPMEYTRLDHVVDVMFTTAKDVATATVSEVEEQDADQDVVAPLEKSKGAWEFTDSGLMQAKREEIVARFGRDRGAAFVKHSRALYWDSAHDKRLACTMSKRYTKGASYPYWFAYHPPWDDFLSQGSASFLILGCMNLPFAFALPWKAFHDRVDALNTTTTKDGRTYWHINLVNTASDHYAMLLPKKSTSLSLDEYKILLKR
jgi:hypothetical protein